MSRKISFSFFCYRAYGSQSRATLTSRVKSQRTATLKVKPYIRLSCAFSLPTKSECKETTRCSRTIKRIDRFLNPWRTVQSNRNLSEFD